MDRYSDEDGPILDFIFDGIIRPSTPPPVTDRARIVQVQALTADVLAGDVPVAQLAAFLRPLRHALDDAVRTCQAAARTDDAGFFDTNRVAYLQAREGVDLMQAACAQEHGEDALRQGLARLESAVIDIEALVSLEAADE